METLNNFVNKIKARKEQMRAHKEMLQHLEQARLHQEQHDRFNRDMQHQHDYQAHHNYHHQHNWF